MSYVRSSVAVALVAVAAWGLSATPAAAQFQPRGPASVGEDYHVEVSFNLWPPTPEALIASESLGIIGTDVDLVTDLGIEKQTLRDLRIVLRPARKHRFRIGQVPMTYDASTTLTREFIFNGLRYRPGLPVDTTAQFKTWRFGYEYDFLYRDQGFLGVLLDAKYIDYKVGLNSPIGDEFDERVGVLPTIGLVGRAYVLPNVAVNGEFSYFKLPESAIEDVQGRYKELDINVTYNPQKNVGVQAGYRWVDGLFAVENDRGTFAFKGLYFGATLRF